MDAQPRLVADVRTALAATPGVEQGLVVAVSGGPDSVALLHAVLAAGGDAGWPIVVGHLNHQLRGAESEGDAEFVRELSRRLSERHATLSLAIDRRDVAAEASANTANLEETARIGRYHWLAEVARRSGARWIATGHTADDQAETVLHRLLRGTGMQGLRGIARRRELEADVGIVRPMLAVRRADVLAYLGSIGQDYRVDSSNADLSRTRSRIRHELLPLLETRYTPAAVELLGRLARQAEEQFREEEAAAAEMLAVVERPRAGATIVLDRRDFAKAPRSLRRALLRCLWRREGWPTDAMGFDAWERLADLGCGAEAALDLPAGVRARCREHVLQLDRSS